MTIDEAIKYINVSASDAQKLDRDKQMRACELGIEALKEIRYLQRMDADFKDYILPGETK